jgi:small subunit ribosomal protein S4
MPRITTKHSRRFGLNLREREDKAFQRKPYPPGHHGKRRKRISEYGKQLMEKQKLKIIYGVREQQFRNYFSKASRAGGRTAQELISLLEQRLDNAVYRLGWATTRAQARQMVSHGHITINGRRVTIPSYQLKVGDALAIRAGSREKGMFSDIDIRLKKFEPPSWLELDKKNLTARATRTPDGAAVDVPVELAQIVEFYSR